MRLSGLFKVRTEPPERQESCKRERILTYHPRLYIGHRLLADIQGRQGSQPSQGGITML